MQHIVVIQQLLDDPTSGSVEVIYTFDGGPPHSQVYSSRQTLIDFISDIVNEPSKGLALALASWQAQDIDLSNEVLAVGKNCIIDFSAPNPIKFQ